MTIIIKEGEWLTHEDGGKYAVALRDIEAFSAVASDDFKLANGTRPIPHSRVPMDVMRSRGGIVREVNINGEWRNLSKLNQELK